jgi:hypothetical protein
MSQPSLPPDVLNISGIADDASALTAPTTTDITSWLKPHLEMSVLFELKPRSGGRVTSKIWNFFHVIYGVKDGVDDSMLPEKWKANLKKPLPSMFACCNCCGDLIGVGKLKDGTNQNFTNTAMTAHLGSNKHVTTLDQLVAQVEHHLQGAEKKRKMQKQSSMHSFTVPGIPASKRHSHMELLHAKFIVDCDLPLSMVEKQSFRELMETNNKHYKPVSSKKIRTIIINLEDAMRVAAVEAMKDLSICLTLDHWTSKANQNYTGITGHFIDNNFKLHSLALGMFLHEGGSTSDKLALDFVELHYNKLKTSDAKIFAITTDTTSNMNKFGEKLEGMGVSHIYCTDHVLQLTCKKLYEKKAELDQLLGNDFADSVTKARALVTFFNQSTQALEKLKKAQLALKPTNTPLGVVTDVVTRWWSTHDMIQCLIVLKDSVTMLQIQNEIGNCAPLENNDWDNLENLMKILKPFKDAQQLLEGEKYVTASFVAQAVTTIRNKLKAIAEDEDPYSEPAQSARSLYEDFQERWRASDVPMFQDTVQRGNRGRQIGVHPALLIATFLDPRFKTLFTVPDGGSKLAIKNRVLQLMKESETAYRASLAPAAAPTEEEKEAEEENEDEDDMFAAIEAAAAASSAAAGDGGNDAVGVLSVDDACSDELKRYVAAPMLSIRTKVAGTASTWIWHDPLDWWNKNQIAYPILARLAKIYLAVQATSAPSERIFSLASRIISSRRSRLDPSIAGKMLFVSQNWKWWQDQLDFYEATVDEVVALMEE